MRRTNTVFPRTLYWGALLLLLPFVAASADPNDHGHEQEQAHHQDEHAHDPHEEQRVIISDEAAQQAGIVTAVAEPQLIRETLALSGRIRTRPDARAEVRARFPGVVQQVNVSLGDAVAKGDLLAVVEANESLNNYNVVSPTSGVVVQRDTFAGTMTADKPLFVIADLSRVWAELHVFPQDLPHVGAEQPVRLTNLEQTHTQQAAVEQLLPTVDEHSQVVIAVVPLTNERSLWRPGMAVYADVMVGESRAAVAVTTDAIQRMDGETVVFVKEGQTYEARQVVLGQRDHQWVEALSGVQPGEVFVSAGSFTVKAELGKQAAGHDHHH